MFYLSVMFEFPSYKKEGSNKTTEGADYTPEEYEVLKGLDWVYEESDVLNVSDSPGNNSIYSARKDGKEYRLNIEPVHYKDEDDFFNIDVSIDGDNVYSVDLKLWEDIQYWAKKYLGITDLKYLEVE